MPFVVAGFGLEGADVGLVAFELALGVPELSF